MSVRRWLRVWTAVLSLIPAIVVHPRILAPILWQCLRRRVKPSVVASLSRGMDTLASFDPTLVLDIGANRGQFSAVAVGLWPKAAVVAFDPLAEAVEKLRRVLYEPRHSVYQLALSDVDDDRMVFHILDAADSSSLLSPTRDLVRNFPSVGGSRRVHVTCRRLDGLFDPNRLARERVLVKIDVQGAELGVLKGFGRLLESVDWLVIEVSAAMLYESQSLDIEVLGYLRERGFDEVSVPNVVRSRDGAVLQRDVILARDRALQG